MTVSASTPSTPVTSSQAAPSCGGEIPPAKPDGQAWTCSFDDEFDASTGDPQALNTSVWTPQLTETSGFTSGPTSAQVCYVNSPDTINVSGGALHLTVRQVAQPIDCGGQFTTQYEGGMVTSGNSFSQTYGRFEVRAMLPQADVQGLQETLWLWPQNPVGSWPGSGEIDLSEFYSLHENLDIPFLHYNFDPASVDPVTGTNLDTNYCHIDPTGYNDYTAVWEPGSVSILINGTVCLSDNYLAIGGGSGPFDQPFFVALTQALGIGANAFVPGTTPLPATTSVQFVRVWS